MKNVTSEKNELNEKVLDLQSRSMRDNLLFYNIPECATREERSGEKCEEKIRLFCESTLKIENMSNIKIDRAHRVGRFRADKNRPIVVKFNFYQDKLRIKGRAYEVLKDTHYGISDQYPKTIQDKRKLLYPAMNKAKGEGKHVTLSYDKLYINGELYHPPRENSSHDASV